MKKRFPQIVAIVTLILIGISVVLTFVGAFMDGELGQALLFTGIFGFVAFAIFGWVLIAVFKWVHKDAEANEKLLEGEQE